ncbi:hypothetical protein LTR53_003827 [Teratosphaeriaceae sp. CCFEE 6253]|nr:hypothetical protein LTR53_003827 [Teratosphaeriaceae sp. CCFEE 6253]
MGECAITLGYNIILVVPEAVLQELEPAWATCYGDIRGVYDPPIALTATDAEARPTVPGVTSASQTQTRSATPGSGLGPSTPSATAGPTTAVALTAQPYDVGSMSGSDAVITAVSTQQTSGTLDTGRGSTVDGEAIGAGFSGALVAPSGILGMTSSGEQGSGTRGSTTVESSAGGTTIAASQPTSTSMGTSTGSMSEKLRMSLGAVLAVCMFGVVVL